MGVHVNTNGFDDAPADLICVAIERTLAEGAPAVEGGEVSLTLLTDAEISELNRDYLGKDGTTDVIAFSLGSDGALLGDVYLCVDQARRQAGELKVPLREELARLAIHGTLHVLGQDHPEGEDRWASPMFAAQERLLAEVLSTQP